MGARAIPGLALLGLAACSTTALAVVANEAATRFRVFQPYLDFQPATGQGAVTHIYGITAVN